MGTKVSKEQSQDGARCIPFSAAWLHRPDDPSTEDRGTIPEGAVISTIPEYHVDIEIDESQFECSDTAEKSVEVNDNVFEEKHSTEKVCEEATKGSAEGNVKPGTKDEKAQKELHERKDVVDDSLSVSVEHIEINLSDVVMTSGSKKPSNITRQTLLMSATEAKRLACCNLKGDTIQFPARQWSFGAVNQIGSGIGLGDEHELALERMTQDISPVVRTASRPIEDAMFLRKVKESAVDGVGMARVRVAHRHRHDSRNKETNRSSEEAKRRRKKRSKAAFGSSSSRFKKGVQTGPENLRKDPTRRIRQRNGIKTRSKRNTKLGKRKKKENDHQLLESAVKAMVKAEQALRKTENVAPNFNKGDGPSGLVTKQHRKIFHVKKEEERRRNKMNKLLRAHSVPKIDHFPSTKYPSRGNRHGRRDNRSSIPECDAKLSIWGLMGSNETTSPVLSSDSYLRIHRGVLEQIRRQPLAHHRP